jgi:hypothetical protein
MLVGEILRTILIAVAVSGPADGDKDAGFTGTSYPRIAMMWSAVRGDNSLESIAKHDLAMLGFGGLGLKYNRQPVGLADGFTPKSVAAAKRKIEKIRELNPDIVICADLLFYEWGEDWLPEDHPWWLRKEGKRQQFWPGTYRMNWYDPEFRHHVVRWTKAVQETGVDGIFYDNIRNEPEPWVAFLTEVRQVVGDDFLIFANAGYNVGDYDFAAPFLNGIMYESGWSHNRHTWDETIRKMQHTETLLRTPRISLVERFEETRDHAGWPGDARRGQKPEPDPEARRWSLCFALIMGNYYYLFADNTSHRHDWYPEYDVKIGLPQEPGRRINAHVWQRHYEKALVVVNLPGSPEAFSVHVPSVARDSLTSERGNAFSVAPGSGRILVAE